MEMMKIAEIQYFKLAVIGKDYEFFVDNKCHFLLFTQIQLS
jgi:hypothetical protein